MFCNSSAFDFDTPSLCIFFFFFPHNGFGLPKEQMGLNYAGRHQGVFKEVQHGSLECNLGYGSNY
jgi:hypothetical protein